MSLVYKMKDGTLTGVIVFVVFVVFAAIVAAYASGSAHARSDPRDARRRCDAFCSQAGAELVEMQAHGVGDAVTITCTCFFDLADPE